LQYARYLAEHLSDILLRIRNPLRKAAFFGAIFNQVPSYEILAGGTQNNSAIPGVNELFRIGCFENPNMVTSRIFQWNSLGQDLVALYLRLVDLGMEYRDGQVYLADLEELECGDVQA